MAINQLQIPTSGNINNTVDQSQWTSLANLGNVYQKAQQDAANKAAFAQYQQTGDPKALIGSGDMNLAQLGISAKNHQDALAQQVIENKRADINTGINQTNAGINQGRFTMEKADWDKTPDQYKVNPDGSITDLYAEAQARAKAIAAQAPSEGFEVNPDFGKVPGATSLRPISGGPRDPNQIKSEAEAKRAPGMGDDALKPMVESYRAGNTGVLTGIGRGTQGPQNLQRFWELLSKNLADEGKTGNDLAAAKANFMSQTAAAKTAAVREATVESAVNEAKGTFPLILQRSAELPRGSFVPYNKLLDMVRTNTSSPEQNRYNASIQAGITAYSQAMSRTGASTVHSQQHAEDILNKYSGPEGIKAALEQLQQEMEIAKSAPEETRKSILEKIIGIKADPGAAGATSSPGGAHPDPLGIR